MKNFFQIGIVFGVFLTLGGCVVKQTNQTAVQPLQNNQVNQAVNCNTDSNCADNLLASCGQGSFLIGVDDAAQKFVVKGQQNGKCTVDWGYTDSNNPVFGNSTMNCNVPLSVKTISELPNYLFSNKFQDCNGDLKDKIMQPRGGILQDLNKEPSSCNNDVCVASLLATCGSGSFSVQEDNSEIKFTVKNQVSTGCVIEGTFVNNQNKILVGETMSCLFPDTIKSILDVKNLIKNKYIISDQHSSYSVCTLNNSQNKMPTVNLEKSSNQDWQAGSFEKINFEYPKNFTKVSNSTKVDSPSILLWSPDRKYFIEISRQSNIRTCLKNPCRSPEELSLVSAQEELQQLISSKDTRYVSKQMQIDGHNAVRMDGVKPNVNGTQSHRLAIVNGDDLYSISITASDNDLPIYNSLVDTIKFSK